MSAAEGASRPRDRVSIIRAIYEEDTVVPIPFGPRMEYIIASTSGKADSMNEAAMRSSGDVLVFLDADTSIYPSLEWLETRPTTEDYWVPLYSTTHGLWSRLSNLWNNAANITPLLGEYGWGYGACLMVRRAAFLRVGGFSETAKMEDQDLLLRLKKNGYRHGRAPIVATTTRPNSFPSGRPVR